MSLALQPCSAACLETRTNVIAPADLLTVDSEQHDSNGKMIMTSLSHSPIARPRRWLRVTHRTKSPFAQYVCDTSNVAGVDMTRVRAAGSSCHLRRSCLHWNPATPTRDRLPVPHISPGLITLVWLSLISSGLQSLFVPICSHTNDSKYAAVRRG